jgi:hypothetical protein
MEMVTIYTAINSADADVVNSRLDAAGFHPVVLHELAAQSLNIAGAGIRIQVPEDEAEDVRAFLAAPPDVAPEPPEI